MKYYKVLKSWDYYSEDSEEILFSYIKGSYITEDTFPERNFGSYGSFEDYYEEVKEIPYEEIY